MFRKHGGNKVLQPSPLGISKLSLALKWTRTVSSYFPNDCFGIIIRSSQISYPPSSKSSRNEVQSSFNKPGDGGNSVQNNGLDRLFSVFVFVLISTLCTLFFCDRQVLVDCCICCCFCCCPIFPIFMKQKMFNFIQWGMVDSEN